MPPRGNESQGTDRRPRHYNGRRVPDISVSNNFVSGRWTPSQAMHRRLVAAALFVFAAGIAQPAGQTAGYLVAVASEAADKLTFVRFAGGAARIESEIDTGIMPTDIDGPHGLAVSADGKFLYVSLAHGQPNGSVLKYSTATRTVVGRVVLGMFPATLQASPAGDFLYVVNFNLHGDPVPSSVSIVLTERMAEIARVPTCRMPHGSRVSPDGTKHYFRLHDG